MALLETFIHDGEEHLSNQGHCHGIAAICIEPAKIQRFCIIEALAMGQAGAVHDLSPYPCSTFLVPGTLLDRPCISGQRI